MKWLQIKNQNSVGEIYIYGEITDNKWMDDDVTPNDIKQKLDELKSCDSVDMFINSNGGAVFAGIAIYNMIKSLDVHVTAHIVGLAASIASVVAMAADKIIMPRNSHMMIHNVSGVCFGTSAEMRKTADTMDGIEMSIISTYQTKADLTEVQIKEMLDNETWMNGEEAVAFGFADVLDEETKIAACYTGNIANFNGIDVVTDEFKSFPLDKIEEKENKLPEIEENIPEEPKNVLNFELMAAQHEHNMKMLEIN